MNVDMLHLLPTDRLRIKLLTCCASKKWVDDMIGTLPVKSIADLQKKAETVWFSLSEADHLQAFDGHAKIGDLESLKKKYANTSGWSRQEQAGMAATPDAVIGELINMNRLYEKKFGFIFIVFATGKTAEQLLGIIKKRYRHSRNTELRNASIEQNKITTLRLEKLIHQEK